MKKKATEAAVAGFDLSEIEKEENEKKLNLSTFEEDTYEKDEKKASYTSTKSKKLMIAVLGGVFVLLIALYPLQRMRTC